MYTVIEIADLLNVTVNVVYKAVYDLQMVRYMCINKKNHYSPLQVATLRDHIKTSPEKVFYYPLKTTETFYIFESKLNNH